VVAIIQEVVTMEHAEAIRSGAAERYLLDELDEAERSRYEEHYFDCRECAEDVKSAAAFAANAKEVLPSFTRERVVKEENGRARGTGWIALFWPAPAGAMAALVLSLGLGVYQAAVVAPGLRRQVAEAEGLQPAAMHFLSLSRSGSNAVRLGKDTRALGLTLSTGTAESFAYYRCELREPGGRVVKAVTLPAPAKGNELNLVMHASNLPPGPYVLVLQGLASPGGPVVSPDVSRYPFVLERE
jgi:hypothetical protein